MKRTGLAIALTPLAGLVTVAGLATAGAAAPAPQPEPETRVVKAIRGTCDIPPVGDQVVAAELTLTLPTSVAVGMPVQPKDVRLRLTFAADTSAALRQNGITSIEGIAGVRLTATADKPVVMPARGPMPRTELPESGPVTIEVPVRVAAQATASKPGKIAITLGPLELLLAQVKALQEPTGEATPVACTPDPGQDTAVGEVRVLHPASETTEPTTPTKPTEPTTGVAPTKPKPPVGKAVPEPEDGPRVRQDEDPPDPCQGEIPPDSYNFWSYYDLSGRTEVRKLKSGIDLGPGYLSSQLYFWFAGEFFEIACGAVFGDLMWPPAGGSFVAFGFVPTTADVTVVPVGRAEGRLRDGVFTGTAKVHLKLGNVRVNGTPLPVGPACQTAQPVVMDLKSVPGEWDVFTGGTMETDVTIPAYTGCGVTQDLDPLFTGLITAPGNHTRLTFGNIVFCEPPDQPCVPRPARGRR